MKKRAISALLVLAMTLSVAGSAVAGTYTIKWGDTLSEIAERYGTNYQELAKENVISNPDLIFEGQQIKISDNKVTVKYGKEAAIEPLKTFTNDFDAMFKGLDPMNLYAQVFQGKFLQKADIKGAESRPVLVYLPEGLPHCYPSVFVVPADGQTAEQCFQESGWKEVADKYKFHLFILEPKNGKWDLGNSEAENAYLNAAFTLTRSNPYYNTIKNTYYLVGYKEGGTVAQQFAMKNPTIWAGLATFDGSNVSKSYMEKVGAQPSDDKNISMKDVPLPVWNINSKTGETEESVINYWKNANKSEKRSLKSDYATVYMPSRINADSLLDEEPIAEVWITEKKNASQYDEQFNEVVWESFLSKTQRYVGIANGDLRPAKTYKELGIERRTQVVDGYMREWYEYIPTSVKKNPDAKVPMLMAFHGGSQTGEMFIYNSQWYKIAEERGFIVVFPTSFPTRQKAVPKPSWNVTADTSIGPDEIPFVKTVVGSVKSRYKIDDSRVYASGLSMGSVMTQRVAMAMPDVFAAAGSFGGVIMERWNAMYTLPDVKTDYEIPMWIMMGENDSGGGTFEVNKDAKNTIKYWIGRNKATSIDKPDTYKNGRYNNKVYNNESKVPMVRFTNIDIAPHMNAPQECWMLWDEFLSKFSRDSSGKVLYQQSPISR
ncbi:MAG: hypothetical protein K0R31_1133 [Clostridiales bacterium]|nr:hypothetical protein [Clostridiales bacterium]